MALSDKIKQSVFNKLDCSHPFAEDHRTIVSLSFSPTNSCSATMNKKMISNKIAFKYLANKTNKWKYA